MIGCFLPVYSYSRASLLCVGNSKQRGRSFSGQTKPLTCGRFRSAHARNDDVLSCRVDDDDDDDDGGERERERARVCVRVHGARMCACVCVCVRGGKLTCRRMTETCVRVRGWDALEQFRFNGSKKHHHHKSSDNFPRCLRCGKREPCSK